MWIYFWVSSPPLVCSSILCQFHTVLIVASPPTPNLYVLFPQGSQGWGFQAESQAGLRGLPPQGCTWAPSSAPAGCWVLDRLSGCQVDSSMGSGQWARTAGQWFTGEPLVELQAAGRPFSVIKGSSIGRYRFTMPSSLSMRNLVKFHLMAFPRMPHPLGWTFLCFHSGWAPSLFTQALLYISDVTL